MVKEEREPPSPHVINVGNQDIGKDNVQQIVKGTPKEGVLLQEFVFVARKASIGKINVDPSSTRMERPLQGKRKRKIQKTK